MEKEDRGYCCFICDKKNIKIFKRVMSARTRFSDSLIINKLSNLVGNECVIVVGEYDYLCSRCYALFNEMDKFEKDLENVKTILSRHLNYKYGIFDEITNCGKEKQDVKGNENNRRNSMCGVLENPKMAASSSIEVKADVMQQNFNIRLSNQALKQFRCSFCDIKMPNRIKFNKHIIKNHIVKEQTLNENCTPNYIFTCRICNLSFINLNLCRKHFEIKHLYNLNVKNISVNKNKSIKLVNSDKSFNRKNKCYLDLNKQCLNVINNNFKVRDNSGRLLNDEKNNETGNSELQNNDKFLSGVTESSNLVVNAHENDKCVTNDTVKYEIVPINNNENSSYNSYSFDVERENKDVGLSYEVSKENNLSICQKCGNWINKYCKNCKTNENCSLYNVMNSVSNVSNEMVVICADKNLSLNRELLFPSVSCSINDSSCCFEQMKKPVNNFITTNSNENLCKPDISNLSVDQLSSNLFLKKNQVVLNSLNEMKNSSFKNTLVKSVDDSSKISENLGKPSLLSISNEQNGFHIVELFNNQLSIKESSSENQVAKINVGIEANVLKDSIVNLNHKLDGINSDININENIIFNFDSKPETYLKLYHEKPFSCDDPISPEITKTFEKSNENVISVSQNDTFVSCSSPNKYDLLHCQLCNKSYSTDVAFQKHFLVHSKNDNTKNSIACCVCDDNFSDISLVYEHIKVKHSDFSGLHCFTCNINYNSSSSNEFFKHCKSIHLSRRICPFCGKNLKTKTNYLDHIRFSHRSSLNCFTCNKSFTDVKKLKIHEKNHEKCEYKCDICDKLLKTRSGLKLHKLLHSGVYPLICEFCGKGFVSSHSLREHKSKHSKQVQYICDICGKEFRLYDTYHKHRTHHDNPYPKQCDVCKQFFRSSSRLSEHKRRKHTLERPYKCPYCPSSFHISNLLKYHLCIHTKQYPFTCKICQKGFPARNKHALHMLRKHNDDSFIKNRLPNNQERKEEWLKLSRRNV